jgi:hypothetical protein
MAFATGLYVAKKCPAHRADLPLGAGRARRGLWRIRNALVRVYDTTSTLRAWHNDFGALSGPFAVVHASFAGGSLLTLFLLLALAAVIAVRFSPGVSAWLDRLEGTVEERQGRCRSEKLGVIERA